jgi:hypothetical protein
MDQSATLCGRRQCNVIATSGKSADHKHSASRYVKHNSITEDLVKCRDESTASLGV